MDRTTAEKLLLAAYCAGKVTYRELARRDRRLAARARARLARVRALEAEAATLQDGRAGQDQFVAEVDRWCLYRAACEHRPLLDCLPEGIEPVGALLGPHELWDNLLGRAEQRARRRATRQ